tara:strand:+ start:178 stop:402 length:225 start_codon:yes stop_codon:yes gene_type:complete
MIELHRTSPLTGEVGTMVLDTTKELIDEFFNPNRTRLIQDIFPNLSVDEREFIQTGYTPEDWKVMEAQIKEDEK